MRHSIRAELDRELKTQPSLIDRGPDYHHSIESFDSVLSDLRNLLDVDVLALLLPQHDEGRLFSAVAAAGTPLDILRDVSIAVDADDPRYSGTAFTSIVFNDRNGFDSLSPLRKLPDIDAVTILPLALDGRLRGMLHLGAMRYGTMPSDARLLELVAKTMTGEIERVDLRHAEASARSLTERAHERLRFLTVASGLLSSSLDYETTLTQITSMLVPRLADVCAIVLVDEDDTVSQVTVEGIDPEVTRKVRELQSRYSLRLDSPSSLRRVLDSGRTDFHPSLTDRYYEDASTDAEHLELLRQIGMQSMVIVPLNGHDSTIGALSLALTGTDRRYTPDEVDFIEELAHRAALAVENARLWRASQRAIDEREELLRFREETILLERQARARAEAAQQREAFLSEASSILSSSLDSATNLKSLSRLIVTRVANWCTIELFDDSGTSSLAAVSHVDPDGLEILERIRGEYLPATIPELPPRHILRYREPTLINNIAEEFWFDSASTPEHLIQLDRLQTTALIVVPLFSRSRTLGLMLLARSGDSAPFVDEDLPMAIDLGHRVSLAIDNSLLYDRAQSVVQQREEFISTASHELKTPLTTVKGYLQLLSRQILREDVDLARITRFTRELDDQVKRLEDLVSDLLDVSRIQQGRLELRLEEFDLAQLASAVLSRFEHAPERIDAHELTLSASEPVIGTWDRGRIDQVLTNLISNALKYSPDGGQILVRVRRSGENAQITVRDNGIGISPGERATLFQPFARGHNVRPKISGTGLGLYITNRIVTNHRGAIFVKSDPGHGTSFIVQLPLTSPELDEPAS